MSTEAAMARVWRGAAAWCGAAIVIALALWIRFDLIENGAVANACFALHGDSPRCVLRMAAIAASQRGWLTLAAAIALVLALLWKHPSSAWLAIAAGGVALALYSAEAGAAALLIGVLRLVRLQLNARGGPGHQHRNREERIAERP